MIVVPVMDVIMSVSCAGIVNAAKQMFNEISTKADDTVSLELLGPRAEG